LGVALIVFFNLPKSKTGIREVLSEKQIKRDSNRPAAPESQAAIPTNQPLLVTGAVSTIIVKSEPKLSAIPMVPTVSTPSVNDTSPPVASSPATNAMAARRQVVTSGEVKGVDGYDAALIRKVQKRWLELLEKAGVTENRSGKVVLEFQLRSNGLVDRVRVLERDTDEFLGYLCESAVSDSAPFPAWPAAMRRSIKSDDRFVQFTFRY
jgi:outer membrane biosynthesis protein TonB